MKAARNENGTLWIFNNTPTRHKNLQFGGSWQPALSTSAFKIPDSMQLDIDRFPSLKWEDEPIEVSLYSRDMIENLKEVYYEKGYEDSLNVWNSVKDKDIVLPGKSSSILVTDGIKYSVVSVEKFLETVDEPYNTWTHWMKIPSIK